MSNSQIEQKIDIPAEIASLIGCGEEGIAVVTTVRNIYKKGTATYGKIKHNKVVLVVCRNIGGRKWKAVNISSEKRDWVERDESVEKINFRFNKDLMKLMRSSAKRNSNNLTREIETAMTQYLEHNGYPKVTPQE